MKLPERWPAPAKLNLMLRVVGRRADGYHELQTVFQFLDICDWLSYSVRQDGVIRRVGDFDGVAADRDLVVLAARRLQAETGTALGVDIDVDKRLPMGAGLGGGSSDAATTLVALNRLWECGLDNARLREIGLSLGADVPVFVFGRAAWAEGIGETLSALDLPEPRYLLLAPNVHVNTGQVFQDPELTRNSPRITIRDFLAGEHGNDCLAVVAKRYPEVSRALEWLGQRGTARLTGTGACVFAEIRDHVDAATLADSVPGHLGTALLARGCNASPLRRWSGED